MKWQTPLAITLLLTLVGALVILKGNRSTAQEAGANSQQRTLNQSRLGQAGTGTQVRQLGAVEVEVRPLVLQAGQPIAFRLTLDTHSVELTDTLVRQAQLVDDQGNTYRLVAWTGGSGGHHLSGDLTYEALRAPATSLRLILAGIDDAKGEFLFQIGGDQDET